MRKAWKILGTGVLAVLLAVGVSTGVILTKREAANQASATTNVGAAVTITAGGAYTPEAISIKKGQSVTWVNQDGRYPRHVMAVADAATQTLRGFGSLELLAKGQSYSYVFEKAGTFHYYDTTTSQTIGTVTVTE